MAQKECYPRSDFGSAEGSCDESTQQEGNDRRAIRPRFLKASKAGKEQILDEFIATTGYHCGGPIKLDTF